VAVGFEALGGADDRGVPAEVMRRLAKYHAAAVRRPAQITSPAPPTPDRATATEAGKRHVGQIYNAGARAAISSTMFDRAPTA
jgi:hypothetical protein